MSCTWRPGSEEELQRLAAAFASGDPDDAPAAAPEPDGGGEQEPATSRAPAEDRA